MQHSKVLKDWNYLNNSIGRQWKPDGGADTALNIMEGRRVLAHPTKAVAAQILEARVRRWFVNGVDKQTAKTPSRVPLKVLMDGDAVLTKIVKDYDIQVAECPRPFIH